MKKFVIVILCILLAAAVGGSVWGFTEYNKAAQNYGFSEAVLEICPNQEITPTFRADLNKEKSWGVDDPTVCEADADGRIVGLEPGETTLSVRRGILQVSCIVRVRAHSYSEASCTEDSYCIYCTASGDNKAFGHNPAAATCTEDGKCRTCGLALEPALGHEFTEADCTNPEKCTRCGEIGKAALGHEFSKATCEEDSACTRCGEPGEEKAIGHDFAEATCTEPATCLNCGLTEGEPLGHTEGKITCGKPVLCTVCGETVREAADHEYKDATCTKAKTCKICGAKEGKALGHNAEPATCTTASVCKRCGKTVAAKTSHLFVDNNGARICAYCGVAESSHSQSSGSGSSGSSSSGSASSGSASADTAAYASRVVQLVNEERAKYGLGALTADPTLMSAAQLRSDECVSSYSHTRPDGSSCFTVLSQYGVSYSAAGENIAAGYRSPEDVVNGWMNSEGHRANILSASFTRIGVGCSYTSGGSYHYYWSQLFTG